MVSCLPTVGAYCCFGIANLTATGDVPVLLINFVISAESNNSKSFGDLVHTDDLEGMKLNGIVLTTDAPVIVTCSVLVVSVYGIVSVGPISCTLDPAPCTLGTPVPNVPRRN